MVNVKIIFFNWNSFYGKAIRLATGSKWTHVGIISQEHTNGVSVYEALNKGLTKSFYSHEDIARWEKSGIVTIKKVNVNVTPGNLIKACENYEGAPYDWLSILNIISFMFLRKLALNFTGAKAVICSEFVARVLYETSNGKINFEEELDKPFDLVTPADIFRSKFMEGDF